MSVFVVVSLTLAVLAVGMAVVSVLQVKTAVRGLLDVVGRQVERMGPLTDELQTELAVAGTELEAMEARRRAHERSRRQRHDRRGARPGPRVH